MLLSFSGSWYRNVSLGYARLGNWLGDDMGRIIYRTISLVDKAMGAYTTRVWGVPVSASHSAAAAGRLATAVSCHFAAMLLWFCNSCSRVSGRQSGTRRPTLKRTEDYHVLISGVRKKWDRIGCLHPPRGPSVEMMSGRTEAFELGVLGSVLPALQPLPRWKQVPTDRVVKR